MSQQDAAEQLSPLDMVFYATMEVGHMIWSLEGKLTCNIFPARRSRWEMPWAWLEMTMVKKEAESTALWPDCGGKGWSSKRGFTPEQSWTHCGLCCSRKSTPSSGTLHTQINCHTHIEDILTDTFRPGVAFTDPLFSVIWKHTEERAENDVMSINTHGSHTY